MIEEVHAVSEQKEILLEEERKRKEEEAEEAKKAEERRKARAAAKKSAPLSKRTSQSPVKKTSEEQVGGRRGSRDMEMRGRRYSRERTTSRDNLSKSPSRPGVARRASSKSPAGRRS